MATFQNSPFKPTSSQEKDDGVWNNLKADEIRAMAGDNVAVRELADAVENAVEMMKNARELRDYATDLARKVMTVPAEEAAKGRVLEVDIKWNGLNFGYRKPDTATAKKSQKAAFTLK